MSEAAEEQVAREKAQVAAMRNAQSMMSAVIARNTALEGALKNAADQLASTKNYISDKVYCWASDNRAQQTVHARVDSQVAELRKVLG